LPLDREVYTWVEGGGKSQEAGSLAARPSVGRSPNRENIPHVSKYNGKNEEKKTSLLFTTTIGKGSPVIPRLR
jgi:hypothetical protein